MNKALRQLDELEFFGPVLQRPECVLALRSGELYVADGRGGYAHFLADGSVRLVLPAEKPEGFLPNGIALLADRSMLIANLGPTGGIWRLSGDGGFEPYLLEVAGRPLPPVNFVHVDAEGRLWATVSTEHCPTRPAAVRGWADGYVILSDRKGTRVVARELGFTNEAKVDPTGRWLYVNETIGRRLTRYEIAGDGLRNRETVYSFVQPGYFPDGLTFDEAGGVWITTVIGNAVVRIDPRDGTAETYFDDCDEGHVAATEALFASGEPIAWSAGDIAKMNLPASLAFAGDDLKTAVIGFVKGDRLARFRSPVAGAPPPYWNY